MKVYLRTYGCRANQYDSETIRGMVERAGGSIVDDPSEADAAVYNSCAVTAEAEAELRKGIRRAARIRPQLQTVVVGCAASLDTGTIAALPGVSHVLPGTDFPAIAAALQLPSDGSVVTERQAGTRALLRIQDGCDEHCTFCATTLARGAHRSRNAAALIEEARILADRHPEIVLTGVHIGSWGTEQGSSLGALVEALIAEVPRVRFRLSSLEATEVDDRLRDLLQQRDRLVPHLHAPLQSGSDAMLKRMGRHWYTASRYAEAVQSIVREHSTFGLGADVIAGFPGETEADHQATISLIRSLPFTYLHVFPYSARPGTAALRLPGQVSGDVARQRARELRDVSDSKQREYLTRRSGTLADVVIVRGEAREGVTEDYLTVTSTGDVPRGTRLAMRLRATEQGMLASPVGGAAA